MRINAKKKSPMAKWRTLGSTDTTAPEQLFTKVRTWTTAKDDVVLRFDAEQETFDIELSRQEAEHLMDGLFEEVVGNIITSPKRKKRKKRKS